MRFDGPRPARPDEIPGLLKFLDKIFPEILTRYCHIYDRSYAPEARDWFHVVTHKGRLASHIGIYPMNFMLPGGGRLLMGGIGAVATAPEFRGKGLMGLMLKYATRFMKAKGMPASILWGNRRRYANYGWEPAGQHKGFAVYKDALPLLARYRMPVRELKDAKAVAPRLARLHTASGVGLEAEPDYFHQMLARKGKRTLIAGPAARPLAYALGNEGKNGWRLDAMAGDPKGVFSIMRQLTQSRGAVRGVVPLSWRRGWEPFSEIAEGWSTSITGIGQVKVLDSGAVLKAYGLHKLKKDVDALKLNDVQAARLLFGPEGPRSLLAPGARTERLAAKLPLPLFLWPAESV